jgi:GH15 family glucan-1,4-alpha-glucosidase
MTTAPLTTTTRRRSGFLGLGDYAAIGDGRTLALVGRDGAIDWMCLPELDSPSVFAAILDPARGGTFVLAPSVPFQARRAYRERTNVLETTYETAEGSVRVIEAVTLDDAVAAPWRELARAVEGMSGSVPMRWRLEPRFDYGSEPARFTQIGPAAWLTRHGRLQIALQSWDAGRPRPRAGAGALGAEFTVREGERALLALQACAGRPLPVPARDAVLRRLEATEHVWRSWVSRHAYSGPYAAAVERSLLALRLLADGRTGAIAAAGTTSLPEALHEQRNYDYRFAWVRDLSFTLDALLAVGMEEIAHAAIGWLLDATARTRPSIDPVYGLDGTVVRSQTTLPLAGYRASGPVHLGNQAGSQLQLGGWGDMLETMWSYVRHGHVLHPETGERLADATDLLGSLWRNEDAGLWELGERAHYTTSKVGCWSAFHRVLDLCSAGAVPGRHTTRWERERDAVATFIESELYSEPRGAYVMQAGGDALDCGVLLMARRGYGDPQGPRFRGTIEAIRSELSAGGPLLYRYSGMREQENAFVACTFWMVEALALAGQADGAAELMDGAVALGNDLGLLSEELEPSERALRGNLPQALSHLALINAAVALERAG